MSEQLLAQGHLKIKCKKNVQSYRLVRKAEQFPQDFCLTITAQEEFTVLEILGESNAPLHSTISKLEWIGTFPHIKKIFLADIRLPSLTLDITIFRALENVFLKNVCFQNMTLERFLCTLPHNLKNLSLIHSAPFAGEGALFGAHLEQLDLSNNQLHHVPPWVETLTCLKRLTLDGNQLKSLPLYLKNLPRLNHLSLDDNPFSEETKGQIQRDFNIWF
ncbi:MAG: hypothetical protein AABY86_15930 [Bdellovibrionota bacterium]